MMTQPAKPDLKVGGTLDPHKHLYITRQDVEDEVYGYLEQGEYCNILCSRQVGKSSLMVNTALRLKHKGVRVVTIDIAGELGTPEAASEWYVGFLIKLTRALQIEVSTKEWWETQGQGTANQRLLQFFREEIFSQDEPRVVIFVDEIDSTLRLPYTDDFFTAIRTMYNERSIVPAYQKIAFCLIGVANPNELIKDSRATAYNVGRTVELRDFEIDVDDLDPLIQAVAEDHETGETLVRTVLDWTGGHPYLTLRLCQEIGQRGIAPQELEQTLKANFANFDKVRSDVHFQQITRFLETRVSDQLATLRLYERILTGKKERDENTSTHIQLKLSGLVKRDDAGNLVVRNRIYEKIFDYNWVRQTEPHRTVRFLRRFAVVVSVLLVVIVTGILINQLVLEPPRRVLTELRETQDPDRARVLYEYLIGVEVHSPLGLPMNGFEAEAESAYNNFLGRHLLSQLGVSEDPEEARQLYSYLSGAEVYPDLGQPLSGFEERAQSAYNDFWGRSLLAQLRVTEDTAEARQLFDYLSGVDEHPVLGRQLTGFGGSAETAYDDFWTRKKNQAAEKWLVALNNTAIEADAQEIFKILTGQRFDPDLNRQLTGFEDRALEAYQSFWERRADTLEAAALRRIEESNVINNGDIGGSTRELDEGLILGALAAVKRDSEIHPEILEVYELRGYTRLLGTFRGGLDWWSNVEVSSDGKLVAVGDGEGDSWGGGVETDDTPNASIWIWDIATGETYKQLQGHLGRIVAIDFSPDGKRLVSGSFDSTVRIWDIESGKEIRQLVGHTGQLSSVMFSPDGKRVITGADDGTVRIWNSESGEELLRLAPDRDVLGVAFSTDEKKVAAWATDDMVHVWDSASGEELLRIPLDSGPRWRGWIGFSPDGQRIAGAPHTGGIRIWDAKSGEELLRLTDTSGSAYHVEFSPDGQFIAAGIGGESDENGMLKIWDTESGEELLSIPAHREYAHRPAYSPNGKWVISMASGEEDTARMWDVTGLGESREPEALQETPEETWQSWQKKLNLTVNDNDEVIDLWPTGPRQVNGWDESLIERFGHQ